MSRTCCSTQPRQTAAVGTQPRSACHARPACPPELPRTCQSAPASPLSIGRPPPSVVLSPGGGPSPMGAGSSGRVFPCQYFHAVTWNVRCALLRHQPLDPVVVWCSRRTTDDGVQAIDRVLDPARRDITYVQAGIPESKVECKRGLISHGWRGSGQFERQAPVLRVGWEGPRNTYSKAGALQRRWRDGSRPVPTRSPALEPVVIEATHHRMAGRLPVSHPSSFIKTENTGSHRLSRSQG